MSVRQCSRLSMNQAQEASKWRLPRRVHGEKDGLPGSLGNEDAGTALENPDIRVPSGTKREDGLHGERRRRTRRDQEGRRTTKTTRTGKRRRTTDGGTGTAWFPQKQPTRKGQEGTEIRSQTATP
ncbi:hypothetical protein NDU88_003700 [Pleurodeles waltl]|uniref:Uncharacterized protein n=1 Tax=Pleurodeles waltl TaxID=8319 RepID=A0AAV7WPU0_PLEWA|nr:hypothetical protein NDU88_003700 [Pleurodeles waltl]